MEKRQQRNDGLLIGGLLGLAVLCGGAYLWQRQNAAEALQKEAESGGTGRIAAVSLDGEEVLRLRLSENADDSGDNGTEPTGETQPDSGENSENAVLEAVLFQKEEYAVYDAESGDFLIYAGGVSAPEDGMNWLRLSDGGIACTWADCPDQVCVKTGTVKLPTETIVCLPHRMAVTILSAEG